MNLQRLWCLLVIIAFSMPAFAVAPYQIDSFDDINDVVGGGADPNWVETTGGQYGSYVEQALVGGANEVTEGAGSMKFDFPSYVPGYKSDEVKRTFSPALDWSSNWEDLAITLQVWTYDPYETRRTTVTTSGGVKLNRLVEISLIDGSGRSGHFPAGPILVLEDTGWNKVIAPLRNFTCKDTGDLPIEPNVFDWNDVNQIVLWARTEHTSDHYAIFIDDMRLELAPDPCSRPYQLASCDDVNDDLWDEIRFGQNTIMFQSDSNFTEGTGSMLIDFTLFTLKPDVTPSLAFIPALDFTDGNDWAFTMWVWTDLGNDSGLHQMILHDVSDRLGRYTVPTPSTYGWVKVTAPIDDFLWEEGETDGVPNISAAQANLDAILWIEMWTHEWPIDGNEIYLDDLRIEPDVEVLSEATVYNAEKATITVDGDASDWAGLVDSDIIDIDLKVLPNEPDWGDLHVKYRLAWDYDYLYILVEEQPNGDLEASEAATFGDFTTDGLSTAYDSLALWFDFNNNRLAGIKSQIGFWLFLGLSSTGQTDLMMAWTNATWYYQTIDPVANGSVATSGTLGSRVIEARVKWSDLDGHIDSWFQPVGGIEAAIQPGYIFGCDPRLQDREELTLYTFDATHGAAWFTGWVWDDVEIHPGDFMPTGRDTYSTDIRLVCSAGDLDFDCDVDFVDYAQFAIQYTETDCNNINDFCDGADIVTPMDSVVDLKDLGRFALRWLLP